MVVMSLQDKESQDASTSALRTIKARIFFVVVDYPMPYIMLSSSEFYILNVDVIANSHDKKKNVPRHCHMALKHLQYSLRITMSQVWWQKPVVPTLRRPR